MTQAVQSSQRIPTGIPGLDQLIEGGLQAGDFILLIGDLGTGKTIFSSQFVCNSAKSSDTKSVFATLEEDSKSLRRNMLQFGMDLDALEREKKVRIVDLEALEGRGVAANIETILNAVDEIRAKRLVVDSLTAFLSGAGEKFDYSFLMHLVYKTLKREGITTLMTLSKPQTVNVAGIEEFVADGIFQLENYVTKHNEMKTRFMIKKLRGADHSRKYHTVVFTDQGTQILPYSA